MAQPNKIIIGVDFGTTFSGIGWLHTARSRDELEILDTFPGQANKSTEKVPTEIIYDATSGNEYQWGWQAKGQPRSRKYFKLELEADHQEKIRQLFNLEYPRSSQNPDNPRSSTAGTFNRDRVEIVEPEEWQKPKEAEEVCTDFLRALKDTAMNMMRNRFGRVLLDTTEKEYVLTVPALWSDEAKYITTRCAMKAFGDKANIKLIAEPEAAAIYVLKSMSSSLSPEDHYVVCDAGGGTVDLITYQVKSTNPLELEESVTGIGDLCGSVYLNRRFEEYLARKLGPLYNENRDRGMERAKQRMLKVFDEEIKPNFINDGGSWEIALYPRVPDNRREGIEDGFLTATNEEIAAIFEPVIAQILQLIEEQIRSLFKEYNTHKKIRSLVEEYRTRRRLAAIILVGGFGSNAYLKTRVEQHFGPNVSVMQPPNAWSAVVRGALLWGADYEVTTGRRLRRSYGIETASKWDPSKHPLERKEPSTFGPPCCRIMKWYAHAGEMLSKKHSGNFPFVVKCSVDMPPALVVDLFTWDYRRGHREPEYRTSSCYKVGELNVDLSCLPKSRFIRETDQRRDYYVIEFELRLEFGTAISFALYFDNVEQRKINIEELIFARR